ncbi:hypothetical protein [Halobacillus mangrovi]|uniref:hypothetical protein n=1 Tax=Halobacillus mangrovi TaxID=402384 RepID=UPI003D9891DB
MSLQIPFNIKFLKNHLENLTTDQFEEVIQQLLVFAKPKYRLTPLTNDGGIDGYERTQAGKNRFEYCIYGVHTKRPNPLKYTKKDKIREDFESALAYIEKKRRSDGFEHVLKKFIVVSNYVLSQEERDYFEKMCEANGIKFEEYHPAKIISLFSTENDMLYLASSLSYINLNVPYSDLSTHKFTEQALNDLCDYKYENKSTTEKFKLLNSIMSTILMFSSINPMNESKYKFYAISKQTKIPSEFISTYTYIDGRFIKRTSSDILVIPIKPCHFIFDNKKNYLFYSSSLSPLYKLCLRLNIQLERRGDYLIDVALAECYKIDKGMFEWMINKRRKVFSLKEPQHEKAFL